MKKKKDYKLSVRLDAELKEPLTATAANNDRSINAEINVAVKKHVAKKKAK